MIMYIEKYLQIFGGLFIVLFFSFFCFLLVIYICIFNIRSLSYLDRLVKWHPKFKVGNIYTYIHISLHSE